MKKITQLMKEAFIDGTPFRRDNTMVNVNELGTDIYLFNNRIAHKDNYGNIFITTCGWRTMTTKERLNALPNVHIKQSKGVWYLNGELCDGSSIKVQ